MSFTVVKETVDYLWVLGRQIDRCAVLGTEFWKPDMAPARERLKAFIGCVWQLYHLAKPVLGSRMPDYSDAFARLVEIKEQRGMMVAVWNDTNTILANIIRALDMANLLVKATGLDQVV